MIQGTMSISSRAREVAALSDEEILRAARRDPDFFAVLVERYEKPFLRKARSIVRTREDAEEVVQDAFTRIYLYADRYEPQKGASFSSWAYAIVVRVAITRYGKLKRRGEASTFLEPAHYESLPAEDSFVDTLTVRDEVLAALSRIPEAAARVLRLQFLEGRTQEEIAQKEGVTVSAVKTRVHRAKKLFKKSLRKNDHDRTL